MWTSLGQCLGKEGEGRPREVREEKERVEPSKFTSEGARQRQGEGRIIRKVRGPGSGAPGLPPQGSPTRKGGELAQVQPSRLIWGEGTLDLIWRVRWGVSTGQQWASPSLALPQDPAALGGTPSICLSAPTLDAQEKPDGLRSPEGLTPGGPGPRWK